MSPLCYVNVTKETAQQPIGSSADTFFTVEYYTIKEGGKSIGFNISNETLMLIQGYILSARNWVLHIREILTW